MGVYQKVQPGVIRPTDGTLYGEGAYVKGRSDRNHVVRVRDVDARPAALRQTPHGTPSPPPASHWFPTPTMHGPSDVIRQGPQKDPKREHRNDYP